MSNLQQLLWRSGPSAGSPNPVTQSNDHNTLRWPGTPPRVSPDRAASGQGRGHAIMTEGLPSKPIPSSWRAWRSFAPSRETRIANHPPASHQPHRTTTAMPCQAAPKNREQTQATARNVSKRFTEITKRTQSVAGLRPHARISHPRLCPLLSESRITKHESRHRADPMTSTHRLLTPRGRNRQAKPIQPWRS